MDEPNREWHNSRVVVDFVPGVATAWWCDHVHWLVCDDGAAVVVCDVGRVSVPSLGLIDTLVRMRLTARRCGGELLLHGAGVSLRALLDLYGLASALPSDDHIERDEH